MLERLLSLVGQGGVHSYADLARQLDVSEELLEQMLQDLARMGYLRPVADGCEAHCAGCSLAETCAIGGSTRVWTLMEKRDIRDPFDFVRLDYARDRQDKQQAGVDAGGESTKR